VRRTVAILALLSTTGCSVYNREFVSTDGTTLKIREYTGILMNKDSGFTDTWEWLDDKTNTLHQVRISRNSKENADAQVTVMLSMLDKLERAYAAKYAVPIKISPYDMNIPPR